MLVKGKQQSGFGKSPGLSSGAVLQPVRPVWAAFKAKSLPDGRVTGVLSKHQA
jgi:hypothetical protein